MNKVFTKESDNEDDEQDDGAEEPAPVQPTWMKNYITPTACSGSEMSSGSCSLGSGRR
jgi:hypothetical protein